MDYTLVNETKLLKMKKQEQKEKQPNREMKINAILENNFDQTMCEEYESCLADSLTLICNEGVSAFTKKSNIYGDKQDRIEQTVCVEPDFKDRKRLAYISHPHIEVVLEKREKRRKLGTCVGMSNLLCRYANSRKRKDIDFLFKILI